MVYIIVKYETAVASAVGKKAFLANRINHWEGMEHVSVLEEHSPWASGKMFSESEEHWFFC